jgi:isoleucyl-tRNA synthetase
MDEVWRSFSGIDSIKSVHQSNFISAKESQKTEKSFLDWERIREVRDAIMPSLEKKRTSGLIGSSLDAKIYIKTDDSQVSQSLKNNLAELRRVFIVSQLYWMDSGREGSEEVTYRSAVSSAPHNLAVSVEKAEGKKCERCWNYSVQVGESAEHQTLCERCLEAIIPPPAL